MTQEDRLRKAIRNWMIIALLAVVLFIFTGLNAVYYSPNRVLMNLSITVQIVLFIIAVGYTIRFRRRLG